jgi:hypothetical protein
MSYNDPIFQKSVMFKNEEDMETPMIFINKEKKHTEYPGT